MRPAFLILPLLLASCGYPPSDGLSGRTVGLDIADVALRHGAPETALQVAQGILQKDPRNVPALVRAGEAQALLGQPEAATHSFETALGLAPDNAEAALGLGRVELATDPAAAAAILARLTTREPGNVAALTDLGIANDLQDKHVQAQDAYRRALAIEPNRAATNANLALSLALSGDPQQAIRILRPLAEAPDASPRMRQNLATALVLAGQNDAATAILHHDMPHAQALAEIAGFRSLLSEP